VNVSKLVIDVEPEAYGFSPERLARITTHFDAYVDDKRLAGWLATVSRGGQMIWSDKGGHRDRERGLEVTDDTIWRIYSMTKPAVAVAVMMLYEEGRFDLLDDVGRWIESFNDLRVWVGGTPESPETAPVQSPILVHHLLTHMSGLTYGFQRRHPVDKIYRSRGYDFSFARGADLTQAVDDFASMPLVFEPGTQWNYSVAFDVLGLLIEKWSGQSLDTFMKERIFDPLGMEDTEWWCPPEKEERLAMLYVPAHGESIPYDDLAKAVLHPPRLLGGGGGLLSTAYDYDRFMTMMLRGGELDGVRLLSSRTMDFMTENHLPDDADLTELAIDSYAEDQYRGLGFGLSMSVVTDPRKNKSLITEGSFAWGGAASTTFWVDPLEDISVAFYTQLLPSGTYPFKRELQQLVYQAITE
jgi:CubicO group peptidase (beta-lactamase class C family)